MEPIIGIDLGTTNSEVAFIFDEAARVIPDGGSGIVPSCVGLGSDDRIIVGHEARNQALAAPERTVMSIKRKMGTDHKIKLGPHNFSPQEISAFILKYLKELAEKDLQKTISKAVITVPAYFTDTQRQATREAGEIAGLEVVRIINEPTAAALAYEINNPEARQILIYDLGGGTFDVSIVKIEDGVVEVLASTGDSHLGGDDFDEKIVAHLVNHIEKELKLSVSNNPAIMARLKQAAEAAKRRLSLEPFTTIEEDHIGRRGLRAVHLSHELSRDTFEEMIESYLEGTMASVNKALEDAKLLPSAIDKVILVGGSTRIPRISQMLEEKIGRLPHSEIDPDLCVVVGAAMQAGREMGIEKSGVLVDITPYTFGVSALGEVEGVPSPHMFVPMIRRNTKLPARKSDVFFTVMDNQPAVELKVYQGENADALDNIRLGKWMFELSPHTPVHSHIVIDFDLDLNGILKIRAMEKKTGRDIYATIENAISRFSAEELTETRSRIMDMWSEDSEPAEGVVEVETPQTASETSATKMPPYLTEVVARAREKLGDASADDQDEIVNLMEDISEAVKEGRLDDAQKHADELDDILFYIG